MSGDDDLPVPAQPKIYHIVHLDRLASIVADGSLWCDAVMNQRAQAGGTTIGMGKLKQNRMQWPVKCFPEDHVGDYVPFYFCSRSVMLYVIHCANHPELAYKGGQGPIVHLEADLHTVIDRADQVGRRWAVSLSNAAGRYAEFRTGKDCLVEIDWAAVEATDFRDSGIRERKQAEFLLKQSFPWRRFERIGVRSPAVAQQVANILHAAEHRPEVQITPQWYF